MNVDVKIVSRLETFLARVFGKKSNYENGYCAVTMHDWLNKTYITDIRMK